MPAEALKPRVYFYLSSRSGTFVSHAIRSFPRAYVDRCLGHSYQRFDCSSLDAFGATQPRDPSHLLPI